MTGADAPNGHQHRSSDHAGVHKRASGKPTRPAVQSAALEAKRVAADRRHTKDAATHTQPPEVAANKHAGAASTKAKSGDRAWRRVLNDKSPMALALGASVAVSALIALTCFFTFSIVGVEAVVDKHVFFADLPPVYTTPRTLVLAKNPEEVQKTHSEFLKGLTNRGHELAYVPLSQKTTTLFLYGERAYDHVLLFPEGASFPSTAVRSGGYKTTQADIEAEARERVKGADRSLKLSLSELLKFVDAGGNVLTFAEKPTRDMRKFANECGVDFHKETAQIVDHFSQSAAEGALGRKSPAILAETRRESGVVVEAGKSILFEGLPLVAGGSELTFNVLSGSPTAFVQNKKKDAEGEVGAVAHGENVALVSAMQARNSARTVFAGSHNLCSNEFFTANAENDAFCTELAKWTFREKGVLRMSSLRSHKVGEDVQPYMYRMMDHITFKIDIEEWKDQQWVPFIRDDVQMEFVMLDPYIRTFLDPPANDGKSITYSKTFKSPDVYGVFKFRIHYARLGYNTLHVEDLAPVRNFKHNDYERFIWMALPYYASCLLVPASLVIFTIVFLYHKEDQKKAGLIIRTLSRETKGME
ncbi:unnamed protein product [Amoebophrya sp. A25]|nr:unnamed protein product [Amoebophrya sp. A25]|eukprot:GSA25T00024402001.1